MVSPYQADNSAQMHRGAIYLWRPVFWIRPPLWILRDISYSAPRHAVPHLQSELSDAFSRGIDENKESVIARAKIRSVAVLSSQTEIDAPHVKKLLVAPFYSLKPDDRRPDIVRDIRSNDPSNQTFYLPSDPHFPDIPEMFLHYRELLYLPRDFLENKKAQYCLTPQAVQGILEWFIRKL